MRLGVPFIAPRQLGAVESNLGRLILPSVDWRTGQSGAHRTVRCLISFQKWRSRPLAAREALAHRHVWCTPDSPVPLLAIGSATCPAQIAWPTVGPADRWLTGQSGAHRTVR